MIASPDLRCGGCLRHITLSKQFKISTGCCKLTRACHRREGGAVCNAIKPPGPLRRRVFAVSDTHVDYSDNLKWAKSIDTDAHRNDVIIVAGDVCDDILLLEDTLEALTQRFEKVFYCVGNHELWIRAADTALGIGNSLVKLQRILELCKRLGVYTTPELLDNNLWIAPLHSWHHQSFDSEPDIPDVPAASSMTIVDYAACQWPPEVPGGSNSGSEELAEWFDSMNDTPAWEEMLATRNQCDIISFSHFLPRLDLLPEKRFLFFPNLAKASGSLFLQKRVAALKPDIHVFGHTHFAWDSVREDGVRYIQAPLSSPVERQRRLRTVSFDVFLSQGEAVYNPVEAAWLPLEIYSSNSVQNMVQKDPKEVEVLGEVSGEVLLVKSSSQEADGGEGTVCAPINNNVTIEKKEISVVCDDELTAGSEAMHGVPAVLDDGVDDDPLGKDTTLRGATFSSSSSFSSSLDGSQSTQRSSLQHGTSPGNLGAHWSAYYESNARTPEVTVLSTWVAHLYAKRRKRGKAAEKRKRAGKE